MALLRRPRAVVTGAGPPAEAAVRSLEGAGLRVRRVADGALSAADLRRARVCVLADAAPAIEERLDGLSAALRGRGPRDPPLRVVILAQREYAPAPPPSPPSVRVTTVDPAREAARRLLARHPLHAGMDPGFGQRPHLLIAGDAPPAQALAVQALRLAHYGGEGPALPLASRAPQAARSALLARHPEAEQIGRLRFEPIADPVLAGEPPVSAVFVCLDPPEEGLACARRLARTTAEAGAGGASIHLETGGVNPRGGIAEWDGRILPFHWLEAGLRAATLLGTGEDGLAQVIHEHYRDSIAAQGRDPAAEPAGRVWADLDEAYRDASREQADHAWAKLALVDCRAVPEERVEVFTFTPLEVERLAEIEHRRWAADRWLAGWTYAPLRDNARRHHPQLIPYADLSGPMKDLDRYAVRLVPTLLARSGLGIQRLLLAAVAPAGNVPAGRALRLRADEALERLVHRHPGRSLVLAATLEDAATRLVVRRGVTAFDAGFFLLCPRPLSDLLAAQPNDAARRDLLALVVLAERRVPLAGPLELEHWVADRAQVQILLGPQSDDHPPGRWLRLQPGGTDWGFDYAE
jgi:hypothetical protein